MMTTRQARRLQDNHGQTARDLQNSRKTELQALWRREAESQGIVDPGRGPATKDALIQDILSWRFPVDKLNEAGHVLYHAPSSVWSACKHCQARPETTSVTTGQLVPGDVVLEHGMRIRVDEVRQYQPSGSNTSERAWSCPGTVLNADDVVQQHVIPASFLEAFGYDEDRAEFVVERRDAWTISGDARMTWLVELPRPAAPKPPGCSTPALHAAGRCVCAGIVWSDVDAAEEAASDRAAEDWSWRG